VQLHPLVIFNYRFSCNIERFELYHSKQFSIVTNAKRRSRSRYGIDDSKNAALFAIQILALGDREIKQKFEDYEKDLPKSNINFPKQRIDMNQKDYLCKAKDLSKK
jgi:hypothetical protein